MITLSDSKLFLSIIIPTRNRCNYLKQLLPVMLDQCDTIDPNNRQIELIVTDNASTDKTSEYISSLNKKKERIVYVCNPENIGADANFINGVKLANGKYIWLFGDDELLTERGISSVVDILKRFSCSLLIIKEESYSYGFTESRLFNTYGELVDSIAKINPHFLLAHTLITSNIFKREIFDIPFAYRNISSNYGHMYAMLVNLINGGHIFFLNDPIFIVRQSRAEFSETPKLLGIKQAKYLHYIGKTYNNRHILKYSYRFALKMLPKQVYFELKNLKYKKKNSKN